MENYLRYCKENLKILNQFEKVHAVLGNEACDLDSAVSALVTAYLIHQLQTQKRKLVIPVFNLQRKDLKLHTEVTFFLEETSLPLELVICKDEIDLKKLQSDKKLQLTLVDHNVLSVEDIALESSVVEVIDHHKLECDRKDSSVSTTIEMVGSCCTLVAEKIFLSNASLIDPQIAMLLYGTIVLDTVCLADSAQRVTQKDKDIAKKLESFLEGISKEEIFQTLQKAKFDVSGLTAEELLRKDLKVISNNAVTVAISSVPMLLETFFKRPGLESSLQQFCSNNDFKIVILMGAHVNEKTKTIQRQMAVFSTIPTLQQQIVNFLLSVKEPSPQLQKLEVGASSVQVFHQGNSSMSRKFFLPLVRSFLSENMSSGFHNGNLPPDVPRFSVNEPVQACENGDDINGFDPLSVDGNDSNLGSPKNPPSNIIGHLGISGETYSSQGSSTQNSCPYTPQNSFIEDSFDLDSAMNKQAQTLPSFNSKEMLEKIEHKRGKLRGYNKDNEVLGIRTVPFTPKNSFVDSSFESFESQEVLSMDSDVFLERVSQKKASLADIAEQNLCENSAVSYKVSDDASNGVTFISRTESKNSNDNLTSSSSNHLLPTDKISDPIDSGCADISSGDPSFETAKSPLSPSDFDHLDNDSCHDLNKSDCNMDDQSEDAENYLAETVDFPDSPKHTKLFKEKLTGSQEQDDDETTTKSIVQSIASDGPPSRRVHNSFPEIRRPVPFIPDIPTGHESFISVIDEYFEDNLVTGVLDFPSSSDGDTTEDEELSSEQLETIAKEKLKSQEHYHIPNLEEEITEIKENDSLMYYDTPSIIYENNSMNSDNFASLEIFQDTSLNSLILSTPMNGNNAKQYGFLFEEKASDDTPDAALVQKIRACFDQEKIKDIYSLSGRLQDILSPNEIEEILTHSDIYSEFIDDEMFEVLSVAQSEILSASLDTSTPLSRNRLTRSFKKTIRASRSQNCDVMNDIRIRAVFEGLKKSGEKIVGNQLDSSKLPCTPIQNVCMVSPSNNVRAFFEESLVKSASALKKISPRIDDVKSVDSKENDSFESPVKLTPINCQNNLLLNINQLEDVTNIELKQQCSSVPYLHPDGKVTVNQLPLDVQNSNFCNGNTSSNLPPKNNKEEHLIVNSQQETSNGNHKSEDHPERPTSLSGKRRRKITVNPDILHSDSRDDDQKSLSSISNKSDGDVFSPVDDLITPDDIDTPDELDDSVLERLGSSELIPEFSAAEEYEEERSWKTCVVGGIERKIDMKVIEPYKKVLSHGGYYGPDKHAIIVFSACYLPDRSRRDYDYVMDNLFLYVLTTLDQLVAEDYILAYLHGATQRSNMPSFGWLKRCYQMIDRRLRKNLKGLYLVHPTFWLKTIVIMTRPFISSKFSRKLRFVNNLQELSDLIPMDHVCIPDKVKQLEFEYMINKKKKQMKNKKAFPGSVCISH